MEIQQQTLPQLVKVQSSCDYKLIVPANVEEKIRYLLRKYPHTEWSGVLFTTHEGTFEDNNLTITCQDVYPMDLGNATFTQFKMSEDVAGYLADNLNLFGCDMGLIHSHHDMSTFFSGTDTATLQSEGNDTNCFVSLIVNNAGTYSAAVTRKKVLNVESTVKHVKCSYEFFGEGEVVKSGNPVESSETKEITTIEYFMLNVEREEVTNQLEYLDARFSEIEKKKIAAMPTKPFVTNVWEKKPTKTYTPVPTKKETTKELNLWDKDDDLDGLLDYYPNPELVDKAVAIMLTGTFLINTSKFDRDNWVTKHMEKAFDKVFHLEQNPVPFQNWAEFIVEYLVENFDDPDAPDYYKGEGLYDYYALVADALNSVLFSYAKENEYISIYCDVLCKY